MANEFVARKGLISLQTSSFLEDVNISGSVYIGTAATSSHLTVSGSQYISKTLTVDGGITGSLYGTSSWAVSASWSPIAVSASYVVGAVSASYIDFAQTADLPASTGRLQWESDFGTLEFTLRGGTVTIPLGFEELSYVYNFESTTLTKGTVVYVSGSNNDRIGVKRASSAGDSTSARTLGLVSADIAAGGVGYVTTRGILRDVNTSTYNAGDVLYVSSSAGQLTNIKPQAPIHMVYAGFVTRVGVANGIIFVFPQNGYELDEIHDVRILNKSTGDLLIQSSSGLWVNSKTLVGQYTINGGLTGSLYGTSSWAVSSSYLLGEGSASYIQFAEVTASQVTDGVGKLQWDELNRTLKFGLGGGNANLQIGQENLVLVYNADVTQIVDGEVLYITGSASDRLAVKKASNTDDVISTRTICVATELINPGEIGFAAIHAEVNNVNTSAFSVGDLLWLDATPGAVTNIKPDAPANVVFVGTVLKVGSGDGKIHVYVQSFPGLRELHDVLISSVQDNQIIKYNQNNGRWENFDLNTLQTAVKTSNYTITSADYVVIGNSATPITITMLPASFSANRVFVIKNKGSGKVTIDATSLGQIDGANTYILNRYQSVTLISDSINWNII